MNQEAKIILQWCGRGVVYVSVVTLLAAICDLVLGLDTLPGVCAALRPNLPAAALGLALVLPGIITAVSFQLWVERRWQPREEPPTEGMPNTAVGYCFLMVFFALAEELVSRGIAQGMCGLYAASILFGLAHYNNRCYWGDVIRSIAHGFVFGALYVYTDSLWAPLAMHAAGNAVCSIPRVDRFLDRLRRKNLEVHRDPYESSSSWYV